MPSKNAYGCTWSTIHTYLPILLKVPKCENFHHTDFFLFLLHKASMGRRLWGKNLKLKFLIFRGSFGGFFFENFVLAQAECALKNFYCSS
jgi:hypothetical protein